MTAVDLREFYEKLYFHEIEARDKLVARLQVPLTLLVALAGVVGFLFQNFDFQTGTLTALRGMFLLFFCGGIVMFVAACGLYVGAYYNHAYRFLPDANATSEYRQTLEQTYTGYSEKDQLIASALDIYLTGTFIKCAGWNTQVNDRRSWYLHHCNGTIIAAVVLFLFSYLAFYFGDLDKGKTKPATEVFILKPIDVRVIERGK